MIFFKYFVLLVVFISISYAPLSEAGPREGRVNALSVKMVDSVNIETLTFSARSALLEGDCNSTDHYVNSHFKDGNLSEHGLCTAKFPIAVKPGQKIKVEAYLSCLNESSWDQYDYINSDSAYTIGMSVTDITSHQIIMPNPVPTGWKTYKTNTLGECTGFGTQYSKVVYDNYDWLTFSKENAAFLKVSLKNGTHLSGIVVTYYK